MNFGKQNGGGRRSAKREIAPLVALLTTRSRTYTAVAIDLSTTGVRLKGEELPDVGEELQLKLEGLHAFAVTCWREDDQCGLEFDLPLSGPDVSALRYEVARAAGVPVHLREAYDHWQHGQAR